VNAAEVQSMSYERKKRTEQSQRQNEGKIQERNVEKKSDGRIMVLARAYRFLVQMTGGGFV
jgi:hypothetical protein